MSEAPVSDAPSCASPGSFLYTTTLLAASVGFINIMNFQSLAYQYNGGAFFIAYLIVLLVIGMPLIQLEVGLGVIFSKQGSGQAAAFNAVSPHFRGFGLASVIGAMCIMCYTVVVAAYSMIYIVQTFVPQQHLQSVSDSQHFFEYYASLIGQYSGTSSGMVQGGLLVASLVTWILAYFTISSGPKAVSVVMSSFFILSLAMLTVLFLRGFFLPGAATGVYTYLGYFDVNSFSDFQMWMDCTSQVIFSTGIVVGSLTTFASYHNDKNHAVVRDAYIIVALNYLLSFLCGMMIFAYLGFLSFVDDVPLNAITNTNIALAFEVLPVALSRVPEAGRFYMTLFFLTLTFVTWNSVLALGETVVAALTQCKVLESRPRYQLCMALCVFGFFCSSFYAADFGLLLMNSVDHYTKQLLLVTLAFCEAVAMGWVYGVHMQRRQIGAVAIIITDAVWFTALFTGIATTLALAQYGTAPSYWGLVAALLIASGGTAVAYGVAKAPFAGSSLEGKKSKMWWMLLGNGEQSKSLLNVELDAPKGLRVCSLFSVSIKHFIPAMTAIMLSSSIQNLSVSNGFKGYSGGYQFVGTMIFILGLAVLSIGSTYPQALNFLMSREGALVVEVEKSVTPVTDRSLAKLSQFSHPVFEMDDTMSLSVRSSISPVRSPFIGNTAMTHTSSDGAVPASAGNVAAVV